MAQSLRQQDAGSEVLTTKYVSSERFEALGVGVQLTRTPERQTPGRQERENDDGEEEDIQDLEGINLFDDAQVDGVSDTLNPDNCAEVSQVIEEMLGELSRTNSVSQDLSETSRVDMQLLLQQVESFSAVRDSVDLDSNFDESEDDNVSFTDYDVTRTAISRIQANIEEDVSDRPESESGGLSFYEDQEDEVSITEYCVNDAVSKKLQVPRSLSYAGSNESEESDVSVNEYSVHATVIAKNEKIDDFESVVIKEKDRLAYLKGFDFVSGNYNRKEAISVPTVVETGDDQNSDDASSTSRSTCSLK